MGQPGHCIPFCYASCALSVQKFLSLYIYINGFKLFTTPARPELHHLRLKFNAGLAS